MIKHTYFTIFFLEKTRLFLQKGGGRQKLFSDKNETSFYLLFVLFVSWACVFNLSLVKCHCWTNDDNIGPKFKNLALLFGGRLICSTISSTSVGPRFVQKKK